MPAYLPASLLANLPAYLYTFQLAHKICSYIENGDFSNQNCLKDCKFHIIAWRLKYNELDVILCKSVVPMANSSAKMKQDMIVGNTRKSDFAHERKQKRQLLEKLSWKP